LLLAGAISSHIHRTCARQDAVPEASTSMPPPLLIALPNVVA
jgi:hypothetical protein